MSLPWQLEECNRFVDAIASGNSKLFSELLQSSQEIRAVDMISLHYACSYSELEILGMLLQDDRFDINARNCRSATPLHIASQNGAVEAVKMLCKANCDLNATNEWGESALHVAVQSAQSNCITVLLEAGCKTDLVDKWGQTPCEVASAYGLSDFSKWFIASVKHVRAAGDLRQGSGDNLARCLAHFSTVSPPNTPSESKASTSKQLIPLSKLIEAPLDESFFFACLERQDIDLSGRDYYGNTALHKLCAWNQVRALQRLLEDPRLGRGDPFLPDASGCSPLFVAVENGATESARFLIDLRMAEPMLDMASKSGDTPLLMACAAGNAEIVRQLMSKEGVDKRKRNVQGLSVLSVSPAPVLELLSQLLTPDDLRVLEALEQGRCSSCSKVHQPALPAGQGSPARAAARGVGAERGCREGQPAGQVARQAKFAAITALLSRPAGDVE